MDNTEFFHTCVSLCSPELVELKPAVVSVVDSKLLGVSSSILKSITTLSTYLNEIQQEYLLTTSKVFNDHKKKQIETEMRLELNKLDKQITHFGSLVNKLSLNNGNSNGGGELIRNLISFGESGELQNIVDETQTEMFGNIVKILQLKLKQTLDKWLNVYDKRQLRIRELNKSRMDTSNDILIFNEIEPTKEFQELSTGLKVQEQVLLKEEQEGILESLKKSTLNQVTQIETSMMDISSMVRDINIHLSVQNEVIKDLDSNQIETFSNVQMGNKDLLKATNKNKTTNGIIFWSIIFASLFLLFIDWLL